MLDLAWGLTDTCVCRACRAFGVWESVDVLSTPTTACPVPSIRTNHAQNQQKQPSAAVYMPRTGPDWGARLR
jgi:Asp-tRNA(Asn)/Glu-tRNA(Gln) amidotransferase A subunit family amidase